MTHDPSSAPKFWWPDTGTSNLARLPCILVPDFSGARNWGPGKTCSVPHQKLGITWLRCSATIGRWDVPTSLCSASSAN